MMVLFRKCPCCCPCSYSPTKTKCLKVKIEGVFSAGTSECNICSRLDGTYLLRATEPPPVSLSIVVGVAASTYSTAASLSATLSFNPQSGDYTISSVTLNSGGAGYSPDAYFVYGLSGLVVNPCP